MATTPSESQGRQPIAPAVRRRLQACFESASKSTANGQFDYAADMLTACVVGDPGNLIYAQNFLGNLQRKYNNNKKGSKLAGIKGAGVKAAIKKAAYQKDWPNVIKSGLEMLKLNPWDVSTLTSMAQACEMLGLDDCQLAYLKAALDADIKDPDVNRLCGLALARLGRFDEAIVCWHRVEQAKPNNEEAKRMIGNLTVEKTIQKGGYEEAESSTEVMADKQAQADRQGTSQAPRLTPEQQLERAIAKDPADLTKYHELADRHQSQNRLEEAEKVLQKALQASGGDVSIRERLEDLQLRRAREQMAIAERQAHAEPTEANQNLYRQMRVELVKKEIEIYRSRVERYPSNLGFKVELAARLQTTKQFNEAIKLFQEARADAKRKGAVLLALGECFQSIKQYKLAMNNYEAALSEISDRDPDQRKLALYRAGVLAMGLKEWNPAEKHLTELAGMDFGYKDVSERLDKLASLRDDGPVGGPA